MEAKKFLKVDRDFVILAESTQIVLNCCDATSVFLKNTLPVLYDELERCHLGDRVVS